MSEPEDIGERARVRREDVIALVLKAADGGEPLSIPDMHRKLAWGDGITKHGLIFIVKELQEQGYVERRWGAELSLTMKSGRRSFVIPCARAYESRAGT